MSAQAQPLAIVTDHSTGYAEQLFGAASNAVGILDAAEAAVPPKAFLPRSARTSLTKSLRLSDSPKATHSSGSAHLFLPGAHRADSLELMLAGISPRFSIPKPSETAFSTGSPAAPLESLKSTPSASATAAANVASGISAAGNVLQTASTPAAHQGDMPRTFSGKVRKLKRHRIASASRLRQPDSIAGQQTPNTQEAQSTQQAKQAQQAQQAQYNPQHAEQPSQNAKSAALPGQLLPQLHCSGGSAGSQHAQHAQHTALVPSQHMQHVDLNSNVRAAQPPQYGFQDLLSIAQQHRLSPSGKRATNSHAMPALQPIAPHGTQQAPDHDAKAGLQHVQQGAGVLDSQPWQQQQQQQQGSAVIQQEAHTRRVSRRKPTAEAADLACVGTVVKSGEGDYGRLGPLQHPQQHHGQQPRVNADIAEVPALFEPYHVKPRGWGTGTLDRKMASLDRAFQKLPPGENRRRSRLEAVSCSAPAMPGVMPHQHSFVLTPGSAALPSQLSLAPHRPEHSPTLQHSLRTQHSELSAQRSNVSLNPQLNLNAQLSLSAELSLNPQRSWQAPQHMHQLTSQLSDNSQQPGSGRSSVYSQDNLPRLRSDSSLSSGVSREASGGAVGISGNPQSPQVSYVQQGLMPSQASFEFQMPGSAAQHEATAKLGLNPKQHVARQPADPAMLRQANGYVQQQSACSLAAHVSSQAQERSKEAPQRRQGQNLKALSSKKVHSNRQAAEKVEKSKQVERGPRMSIEDFSSMHSQLSQLEQQLHHLPDPVGRRSRPQTAEGTRPHFPQGTYAVASGMYAGSTSQDAAQAAVGMSYVTVHTAELVKRNCENQVAKVTE